MVGYVEWIRRLFPMVSKASVTESKDHEFTVMLAFAPQKTDCLRDIVDIVGIIFANTVMYDKNLVVDVFHVVYQFGDMFRLFYVYTSTLLQYTQGSMEFEELEKELHTKVLTTHDGKLE